MSGQDRESANAYALARQFLQRVGMLTHFDHFTATGEIDEKLTGGGGKLMRAFVPSRGDLAVRAIIRAEDRKNEYQCPVCRRFHSCYLKP